MVSSLERGVWVVLFALLVFLGTAVVAIGTGAVSIPALRNVSPRDFRV